MKTAAKTTVAARVREVRENSGLSQERFATKLGFYRRTVERWESGKVLPDRRGREALAQESGKPESFFSPDEGEEGTLTGDLRLLRNLAKLLRQIEASEEEGVGV